MSVHVAYIFPNILPQDGMVFPLAQLFSQLLFLRPVEDDLPEADTPLLQAFTNQQDENRLLAFTCPAPLAEDRERFLGLLQDIRSRPEDYTGHLSNLSAGPGSVVPDDESEYSIVNTLLHQTGIQTGSGKHTSEPANRQEKNDSSVLLWQARLLLKLGESVDKQQADIRTNLARMSQQQEALLRELRKEQREGEGDRVDVDLFNTLPTLASIPVEQQRLRLKAWSRLFFLSKSTFEQTVFISQSSDAIEALLEHYQQATDTAQTVEQILRLPLPALPALSALLSAPVVEEKEQQQKNDLLAALLAQRDQFQQEASTLLAPIREFLQSPKNAVSPSLTATAEQEWIALLDRHYPITDKGDKADNERCTLTLYFLPDISPKQLFFETFVSQDKLTAPGQDAHAAGTGVILGMLKDIK
ncbi:MAG: hypothetical protein D3919_14110 [Candidatus Electrothrix sp. AW5]|nr:hypothetical protein [Candidatus Electrothrix gigas]